MSSHRGNPTVVFCAPQQPSTLLLWTTALLWAFAMCTSAFGAHTSPSGKPSGQSSTHLGSFCQKEGVLGPRHVKLSMKSQIALLLERPYKGKAFLKYWPLDRQGGWVTIAEGPVYAHNTLIPLAANLTRHAQPNERGVLQIQLVPAPGTYPSPIRLAQASSPKTVAPVGRPPPDNPSQRNLETAFPPIQPQPFILSNILDQTVRYSVLLTPTQCAHVLLSDNAEYTYSADEMDVLDYDYSNFTIIMKGLGAVLFAGLLLSL